MLFGFATYGAIELGGFWGAASPLIGASSLNDVLVARMIVR